MSYRLWTKVKLGGPAGGYIEGIGGPTKECRTLIQGAYQGPFKAV